MYLQPTSPLRTHEHITEAYRQYGNKGIAYSLISVVAAPLNKYGHWLNRNDILTFLLPEEHQKHTGLVKTYIPNGAIYIMKVGALKKFQTFYTWRTLAYVMPKTSSVDIDDMDDFEYAEYLFRKKRLEINEKED